MSTEVLETPKLKDQDTNPKIYHRVNKNDILMSTVEGIPVVALCGEVLIVKEMPKPPCPVCPKCEEIYNSLPA